MRYLLKAGIIQIILLIVIACTAKIKPIEYGIDNCAFCDMTIMDNKFSAELVTEKNKSFKFDAIECMLRYNHRNSDNTIALYLIADHANPGNLVDAQLGSFVVSRNLPSPMGEYLSGYNSLENALLALDAGGTLFDWNQINEYINTN